MEIILMLLYMYLGYKANMYLRWTLLGQQFIIYGDVGNFYLSQYMWGFLIGWITIPLAIIVWIFRTIV